MKTKAPLPECGFRFFVTDKGIGAVVRTSALPVVEQVAIRMNHHRHTSIALASGFHVLRKDRTQAQWFATWPTCTNAKGEIDQAPAAMLSATIEMMADAFHVLGMDDPNPPEVLFMPFVAHIPDRPNAQFPVGGTYSPRVRAWIKAGGDRKLPEVQQILLVAFNAMWDIKRRPWKPYEFAASVERGFMIHMHVPGECACLGSHLDNEFEDMRLDVHSHNVDNPMQQLALLAGLIKLAELVELSAEGRT